MPVSFFVKGLSIYE
jgi:hypothetical protein